MCKLQALPLERRTDAVVYFETSSLKSAGIMLFACHQAETFMATAKTPVTPRLVGGKTGEPGNPARDLGAHVAT